MARDEAVSVGQSYRQQQHVNTVRATHKAARMTGSILSGKQQALIEQWGNALTTYCDYFIRY